MGFLGVCVHNLFLLSLVLEPRQCSSRGSLWFSNPHLLPWVLGSFYQNKVGKEQIYIYFHIYVTYVYGIYMSSWRFLHIFTRLYVLEWVLESLYCHKCFRKQITLQIHILGNTVSAVDSSYPGVLRKKRNWREVSPLGREGVFSCSATWLRSGVKLSKTHLWYNCDYDTGTQGREEEAEN